MPTGLGHQDLRHLRAPRQHGQALVVPHSLELRELLRRNHESLARDTRSRHLPDLPVLRRQARKHLLENLEPAGDDRIMSPGHPLALETPLVMTGHQPELFHAGVWFKNFLSGALADRESAVAIHVVTDQDLARRCAIRVPTGSPDDPAAHWLEFDRTRAVLPWEARSIEAWEIWSGFGDRCRQLIREYAADPLIQTLWPDAQSIAKHRPYPAVALSTARSRLERSWGLHNREVYLSRLCQGNAYSVFVWRILRELPRFHEVFRRALIDYRRHYKVRSRTHPAPELQSRSEWLEAPFWIWTDREPTRCPLYVRQIHNELELSRGLSVHERVEASLHGGRDASAADTAAEQLQALANDGVRIRPRALTMTMYLRLFLADLFIHGLGGAKYDRLTDALIVSFFDVAAPGFALATATFRLPVQRPLVTETTLRALRAELREMWYHPERFLPKDPLPAGERAVDWIDRKRQVLDRRGGTRSALERHREIEHINQQLREQLAERRASILDQARGVEQRWRSDQVLADREYPYCVFSESHLRAPLLDLAAHSA